MKPVEYIQLQLDSLKGQTGALVDGHLSDIAMEDLISKTVLSKRFRKYSVDDAFIQHLSKVIHHCVSGKLPIPFVWDFGGYKLWRLSESPEVDWAELFTLTHFAQWLLPIALVYKPGVWFDFYSEDIFVPQINNVSATDTTAYIKSFNELITFMQTCLPTNFNYTLNRLIDQYDSTEQFNAEFDQNLAKLIKELPGGLPVLTKEQAATVELNVKLREDQNKDPLWKEKVQLIHDAYSLASKRRVYYRNESKILVNNISTKCAISVGTAKTSVVKFWVGAGLLKPRGDTYIEHILTPHQLELMNFDVEPIQLGGLTGRNFQSIKVIQI
jgi:hypothetical protein